MDINSVSGFVLLGENYRRRQLQHCFFDVCPGAAKIAAAEAWHHLLIALPSHRVRCMVWCQVQLLVQHEQRHQQPLSVQQYW